MKTLLCLFISGLFFTNGLSAATPPAVDTHCDKFSPPLTGGFCTYTPRCTSNRDLVYYLHGLDNSETTWQDPFFYTTQIQDYWTQNGLDFPTVVSISFGDVWLLAEKNSSPASGLLSVLTESVMPKIEAGLGELQGRRILVGESMGGFNSIQLALKTSLFDKVGILCAPMADLSPFANPETVEAFIEKSDAWRYYKDSEPDTVKQAAAQMLQLARAFFPTPEDWTLADPLVLAQKVNPKTAPDLYVSVGFYDKYLSYEGNEEFVKRLRARGADVQWRPQWGGHCTVDISTISRFLVE